LRPAPPTRDAFRALVRDRLAAERGTLTRQSPERVALLYPSPYRTAMSSLGFQTIYREIHESGRAADRAFLPDELEAGPRPARRDPLLTYEALRPVGDYPVVAVSVAYELELAGLVMALEAAGIPPLAADRGPRHPFVLCGGPLTFSNPLPLAPYADAILMGEADETIHDALDVVFATLGDRARTCAALAREVPSCFVPSLHGDRMPPVGQCDDERLPAHAQIVTPNTELRDMFLVEAVRGCSRGCQYCVMRRSTNGGMRIVDPERLFARIPDDARRVGLVGASVSDHPKIAEIVERLADQGREVGLSSLRPDRLSERFVAALRRGGYRTLTTALDGPSERVREAIQRKTRERHVVAAAERARAAGMERLKLYTMVGLPGEEDADIDELVRFSTELSRILPLSLGVAPFVAKRNTPLDGLPFAGIDVVEDRLERLRRGTRGRVDVRATSARWAWVEYALAQGGQAEGRAVLDAVRAGGRFADWKRALSALPAERPRRALAVVQ
jgi:radical SAM superfamily enzyme YgiQ (UPF0313 family)